MIHKIKFMGAVLSGALLSASLAGRAVAQEGKKAGMETCATCHAEKAEQFPKTFHGRKSLSSNKLADKCESCHGPGGGHVDGGGDVTKIINPKKLEPAAVADLCMGCHKDKALILWRTSVHNQNEVSCLKCHSIHEGEGRQSLVKGKTETCLQCHKKQQADMKLAAHHPVPEGKMSCVSCHNPHGGIEGNLKADSSEELCAKCHAEKVGPYANEHPPVVDGCLNCHQPHGSSVDKLLNKPMPYLCMSCHKWPHTTTVAGVTAFGVGNAEQRGNCIDCHKEIHGSDRKRRMKD